MHVTRKWRDKRIKAWSRAFYGKSPFYSPAIYSNVTHQPWVLCPTSHSHQLTLLVADKEVMGGLINYMHTAAIIWRGGELKAHAVGHGTWGFGHWGREEKSAYIGSLWPGSLTIQVTNTKFHCSPFLGRYLPLLIHLWKWRTSRTNIKPAAAWDPPLPSPHGIIPNRDAVHRTHLVRTRPRETGQVQTLFGRGQARGQIVISEFTLWQVCFWILSHLVLPKICQSGMIIPIFQGVNQSSK